MIDPHHQRVSNYRIPWRLTTGFRGGLLSIYAAELDAVTWS